MAHPPGSEVGRTGSLPWGTRRMAHSEAAPTPEQAGPSPVRRGRAPGPEGRPQVDVGMVTWNTASLTTDALRRLLDTDQGCDLRVLVLDNASEDGTADAIAAAVPEAEVIRSGRNLGFARGMNRLLDAAKAPWFFALNSDAWPEPGAIDRLVRTAEEHPAAAAVAPRLLRPDGSTEHSTHPFPSLGLAAVDAFGLGPLLGRAWAESRCLDGAWAHDRRRQVDWAVGAGLLLRRDATQELGGFDERFFLYVEDLEWCWRARTRGWEIWFEPGAVVRHVGNVSGARRFGERRAALEDRNLRSFLTDALGSRRAAAYRALTAVALARQLSRSRLGGRPEEEAHWRLQLRAALGMVPPPAVLDDGDLAPEDDVPDAGGPEVTVVVPTHDRAERLTRLVGALEDQHMAPGAFEVIVVDDGSGDATRATLEALVARATVDVKAVHIARSGPAAARNVGWRAARAPVVAFTDDDCVPDPDWLRTGLAALGGRPRVVVGRTAPPPDQAPLATLPFARAMDVGDPRFFETCNVFYRRRDLIAAGGFDERFRRPSGEDTHLGLRVAELGVEAVFADDAVVYHDVRHDGARAALAEATRWADLPLVFKGRAYARPGRVHRRLFWKPSHPPALLALAGLAVGSRWRPGLLLLGPWLHYRLRRDPVASEPARRVATLPLALALDATEVATMARGSIRHRTVLL